MSLFQPRNMSFIHRVPSVAVTGMSFKVLFLFNPYSTYTLNEVKLGNNIYLFILSSELIMWEC